MIRKNMQKKYDTQFNFYLVKAINEIIHDDTFAPTTIEFKDQSVWSESNEYLKRVYHLKSPFGHKQIHDRIRMLTEFYQSAALVKYEHPMMVLTKTKGIFLRRVKRMKKMIASDCSSQESSEKENEESSFPSFESSGFLHTIHTEELSRSSNSMNRESMDLDLANQFENSSYDIYQQNLFDPSEALSRSEIKAQQIQFPSKDGDTLNHLICDMDDFDKEKVFREYKKVQEKENKLIFDLEENKMMGKSMKKDKMKSSKIVITPLDDFVPPSIQRNSQLKKEVVKCKQFSKKLPKNKQKYQKKRLYDEEVYDETIRVGNQIKKSPSSYLPPSNFQFSHNSPRFTHIRRGHEPVEKQRYYSKFSQYEGSQIVSKHLQRNRYEQQRSDIGQESRDSLGKLRKKQQIRQRAAALLHKARSSDMKMSYEPAYYPQYPF